MKMHKKLGVNAPFFVQSGFILEKGLSKKCFLSASLNNANRMKKRYAVWSTHSGSKW